MLDQKTKNTYDICNTKHQLTWTELLRFEVTSWYGRTFLNKSPALKTNEKNLLNLGCGTSRFKDWVNADFFVIISKNKRPDWSLDLRYALNCEDNVWDGVFTEHALEHLYPDRALHLLKELHRTMKPGAWLRVTVPDLEKYVNYYYGKESHEQFHLMFETGSEGIRTLTQDFIHLSTWDARLLTTFLEKAGFVNIKKVSFMEGTDRTLLKDKEDRVWETLYIEAQKPTNNIYL